MSYSFAAGDEVGRIGFKFERGSTEFFVVTIVLTNDPQAVRESVARLRGDLRLSSRTEFSFHSTPHPYRLAFLERARTWLLTARCLYVDKRLLPAEFRSMAGWDFYGYFMAQLLDRLPVGDLGKTTLVLDEFGPAQLTLRAVREQLRRLGLWGGKDRAIKRIAFRRSQSEDVIQVADMIGGAVYRRVTEGDETYFRLVKNTTLLWEYRSLKTNPPT